MRVLKHTIYFVFLIFNDTKNTTTLYIFCFNDITLIFTLKSFVNFLLHGGDCTSQFLLLFPGAFAPSGA